MKKVKQEWCENFIRAAFTKHHQFPGGGIECNYFWKIAEESGLWERGTYGSPMSYALGKLCEVEDSFNDKGQFTYSCFKLKRRGKRR